MNMNLGTNRAILAVPGCGSAGGGGSSVPSSLQDTFVDTNSVAIQSHTPTPSGGFTWTVFSGSGAIQSNALQSATSGTIMEISATSANSDCTVGADFTLPGSGAFCVGPQFRMSDANTGWTAVYQSGEATLYELGGLV